MPDRRYGTGLAIFLLLAIVAAAAAYGAFSRTGSQGIEERFESAVGLTGPGDTATMESHRDHALDGNEGGHGDGAGLFLEGNPVMYASILALLAVVCIAAYRKFRI